MTDQTKHDADTVKSLVEVLETEKTALLKGDFQHIEDNYERKKKLLEQVQLDAPPQKDELEKVRSKIKRNQELFEHALSGIQAVSLRINEARRAAQGIDTYDANGNRQRIENQSAKKLEKRA